MRTVLVVLEAAVLCFEVKAVQEHSQAKSPVGEYHSEEKLCLNYLQFVKIAYSRVQGEEKQKIRLEKLGLIEGNKCTILKQYSKWIFKNNFLSMIWLAEVSYSN